MPKLSVCMITYNHQDFIAKSLDSVLMQKTKFDFDLVIGEDSSSDNTRNICLEYANKYPNIINLMPSSINLGMMKNFLTTLKNCRGEFIALCDGDDFWTDPYKLQKQVDYLEANKDVFLCATNTLVTYENSVSTHLFNEGRRLRIEEVKKIKFKDIISDIVPFHTSSVLFRNKLKIPEWIDKTISADFAIFYLCALNGDISLLPDITSVYRINSGGVTQERIGGSHWTKSYLELFKNIDNESGHKYWNYFKPIVFNFSIDHSSRLLVEKKYFLTLINTFKIIIEFPVSSLKKIDTIIKIIIRAIIRVPPIVSLNRNA